VSRVVKSMHTCSTIMTLEQRVHVVLAYRNE